MIGLFALSLFGLLALSSRLPSAPAATRLQLLALGDSYTIGEGVSQLDRWPNQLADLLRAGNLTIGDPQIIARTGWTTADLASALDQADLDPPYDLVTLLIGVNDQYQGLSPEEYRERCARLLSRAIELAGGRADRVLVLSIPDYGVTPFAQPLNPARISRAIEQFNTINRALAEQVGARYVDITPISRQAAGRSDLLAADRLHPSGVMYAKWARLALPAARAALQQ